ncbi:MAG: methyltransferase domain-containing protein [Betaproteobacteria bacterium]|nr:methyltransferase domain-containing protein [Betaproteobacteria bacterium]
MSWDPSQYLKFAGERIRPALDLLARIPASAPETVVDLGCGAGTLATLLLERWPRATLIGVDSSPEMLAKARADHPGVTFVEADVAAWRPQQPVDVLYSNAALHWLPGHDALIPGLLTSVRPWGWLAIQMPRNFGAPSHTCVADAIAQGPWRTRLEAFLRRQPVAEPQHYWRLLHGGCARLEIWETEYLQVLEGDNPVAEFTKGTWLRHFLDRLDEPERSAFEADYRARVNAAYPTEADGRTLFPFRRLFIVAQRAS